MDSAVFFINLFLFALTLTNFLLIRKPKDSTPVSASVDVLIPVRNEEENIPELVSSLMSQVGIEHVHFIFIDDSSTDRTSELIQTKTKDDSRFTLITAAALPSGWLGKPWALSQGFAASSGEILVTLDADVRLKPDALVRSINLLNTRGLDFISPYPRQIAISFAERLIQPLLQWSWLSTVPLLIAERSTRKSLAVANGQFFLVKRSALSRISGFERISHQVIDDIELARVLLASGFHGCVVDGSQIASTRMYDSFTAIKSGYGKSLWKAFGSLPGAMTATLFLGFTSIYPLYLTMQFNPLGVLALELIIGTRLLAAVSSRGRIRDAFLHPLSIAVLIYLIGYSFRNRKTVEWKGRVL